MQNIVSPPYRSLWRLWLALVCIAAACVVPGCQSPKGRQEQQTPTNIHQWNVVIAYPGSTLEISGDGDSLAVSADGDVSGEASSEHTASAEVDATATIPVQNLKTDPLRSARSDERPEGGVIGPREIARLTKPHRGSEP